MADTTVEIKCCHCPKILKGTVREEDPSRIWEDGEVVGSYWEEREDGKVWICLACKARALKRLAPNYIDLNV